MATLNNNSLISYSLLAFCLSFIGLPIYIYLPNYYANNFGISLQSMAFILLMTRLFDTIQDPVFGVLSDRFAYLRKKIVCYLSPFLGLSFLFLFYPISGFDVAMWLVILLIVTYSLFSLIYINYQSLAVSFSDDYHEKTRIISYREFGFIFGIIFAASAPALLFRYFSEVQSFLFIGLIYAFLISVFALIFYYFAPQVHYAKKTNSSSFWLIFRQPLLRKYFVVFLFNAISSAIPAALILFFVEEIIGRKNMAGAFLLLYFVGLLFGVVLWTKVSKVLNDKVKTFVISILSTSVIFVWCYFLGEGDVFFYGLICILAGVGFGGDFALAYSILTDIIQKHKLQNFESAIFGVTNFIIKISLTLSSAILIYFIGFFEGQEDVKKEFISFSYAILPVIFRILAAAFLFNNFKKL
ncbi:MAG: MFS transporter [Rickettsiales bacterium]|nr:MFS transporter [Rickettsiales bacterium]